MWKAHLKFANFSRANLSKANLWEANLESALLREIDFIEADLTKANIKGALNLSFDQLSKAKTLYKAQLDPELEDELRAKGFGHLLDDEHK